MKRFILAAAGLMAAAMASPAAAADMPVPYKAPLYAAPFNWTGFYVGINGGYAWGTSNWSAGGATTGDFSPNGALVGGTIGYNLQTSQLVFGIEGDLAYSLLKGTDTTACCETRNDWFATVRGRVGYAIDRLMPYLTAGAAFGDIKMTPVGGTSETATNVGWTVGGGVEYAFAGAWSAKLEYLYADLGSATCSAATCGVDTDVSLKTNIVRAGVDYHF
jgi:outer membrane immunogenic protein